MGWWGRGDPRNQVRLRFDSKEQAVAYAQANGIPMTSSFRLRRSSKSPKCTRTIFRYSRSENWTH